MKQKLSWSHTLDFIPFVTAGFSLLLGLLVIAGGLFNSQILIGVEPSFAPMQFNTALCFFLFGAGFLSLLAGRRFPVLSLAALIAMIALLTLAEYLFNAGFGIDQLLVNAYVTDKTPHPGRMAPNTAICFTLSVFFLLIAGRTSMGNRSCLTAGIMGAIITAFALIALSGYLIGIPHSYSIGGMTAMAFHTAIGFTAVGFGIIAHALQRGDSEGRQTFERLPFIAGIGGIFITILLTQAMRAQEVARISASMRSTLDIVIPVLIFTVFLLLSLAIHFALKARRNAREISRYNKKLEIEIAERKIMEKDLADAEAKYRSLIENIPAITYIAALDASSTTLYISPQVEEILGFSQTEWMADPGLWHKLLHPEDRARVLEEVDSCHKNDLPFESEYRMTGKDGTVVWIHDKALMAKDTEGRPLYLHGFMQDITVSRKAENELMEQLHFLQVLIDAIPAWIYYKDTEGKYFGCNAAMTEFLGIPKEKILGGKVHDILSKESADVHHAIDEALFRSTGTQVYESRARRADGSWHDMIFYKATFNRKDNTLGGLVGVAFDITGNKKAEKAMQESQRVLSTLMGNLPGMAYRCGNDSNWTMEFVSDGCLELTGYGTEELINNSRISYGDVIHPDDRNSVWEEVQVAVRENRNYEMNYRITTAGGDLKWVWERGSGVYSADHELIALEGFISDVTEHKSLEAQLRHAQKMEAIGVLSGGIAHDFNNIINVIMGFASLLEMDLEKESDVYDCVQQIFAAAERAANLTKSLLAFSRRQVIELRPTNLNDIMLRMWKLLQILIREDIELKISTTHDDLPVMADAGQIEQVLVNLTTNAVDAMPNGGMLSISSNRIELDGEYVNAHGYGKAGTYALLAFSDTGGGMDETTRQKIFEPFFTTKEVGKGTGLGLSIIYGIIKQHNGYINCYSEPGKGTTFRIYLPLIDGKAERTEPTATLTAPQPGVETILLAEDDAQLRELTKSVLEGFGYTVIEAADGENAVAKFAEHRQEIRLSILDVIMPGKNGREVYEEIMKIRPDSKVLFTSGYPEDIFNKDEIVRRGLDFIAKPVVPTDMLRKIRQVLDRDVAGTDSR